MRESSRTFLRVPATSSADAGGECLKKVVPEEEEESDETDSASKCL